MASIQVALMLVAAVAGQGVTAFTQLHGRVAIAPGRSTNGGVAPLRAAGFGAKTSKRRKAVKKPKLAVPKKSKLDYDTPQPVGSKESLAGDVPVAPDALSPEDYFQRLNVDGVHPVDLSFPGLKVLHLDPPVYRVEGLLSAAECAAIRALPATGRCFELPREANTAGANVAARRTSTTWYARFREEPMLPLVERASQLFAGA
mmetsp:Transcript_17895/g.53240  ORF Transcript_17895/g.53240 Transcript_17895/m.53240 type:complete len:202 (+) Transcript_17895:137-742(+)